MVPSLLINIYITGLNQVLYLLSIDQARKLLIETVNWSTLRSPLELRACVSGTGQSSQDSWCGDTFYSEACHDGGINFSKDISELRDPSTEASASIVGLSFVQVPANVFHSWLNAFTTGNPVEKMIT